MKFKRMKPGALPKLIVAVLLTGVIAYVISALTYGLFAQINLFNAVKDPASVVDFLVHTERINLLIPIILTALALTGFLRTFDIWEKSYKGAAGFGVKGTAKWGDPLSVINGKTLSKNSRFHPSNFRKNMEMDDGIIVGKVPGRNRALIVPKDTNLNTRNVYVNGASGSGKGQAYVYTNLVNIKNENIIVIDPKGENYHVTHQLKRDQGYHVYQIDFAEFSSACYNPLDYVKNDEDAKKISSIITQNSSNSEKSPDPFFSERAEQLLTALISYVKATYPPEDANMSTLIEVYKEYVADEETCEEWLKSLPEDHPAKGLLISVLSSIESKVRSSVIASFDSVINIFQYHRVKNMTACSDFTFDQFQKEKSVLYVKIKVPTNPYAALTSVFFSQMIDRFFELGDQNAIPELDIPVHFLLDEFPNIGKIKGYENTLSLCRGYKIYMHTIVQDISQLQEKRMYGPESTKTILANHSIKLILKVGEKEGAKYWSDWIGNTTLDYKNESTSISKKGSSKNRSTVYEQRALLPPNELMSMDDNTVYLLLSGHDPLTVEKAWQFVVFPGLLFNKNREPHYNEIRDSLGYTSSITTDDITTNRTLDFSEYQKAYAQQSEPGPSSPEKQVEDDTDELTQDELELLFEEDSDHSAEEPIAAEEHEMEQSLDEIESEIEALGAMEEDIEQEALDDLINTIADEEIVPEESYAEQYK